MINNPIEQILRAHKKDILTSMTFTVKEIGGNYSHRPAEEIHSLSEAQFQAHSEHLFLGDTRPLARVAEIVARKRAEENFQLHELLRAAYCFKKAVYPLIIRGCWDDRIELVAALLLIDKSSDCFVVNLAQAYLHYAKEYLGAEPLDFPVWVEMDPLSPAQQPQAVA